MNNLLKGAPVTKQLNSILKQEAAALSKQNITPTLAIVRIGNSADDISYEKSASTLCKKIGIRVQTTTFPSNITQIALCESLYDLSGNPTIHGILLLRPLPPHICESTVYNYIAPQKDVDGITKYSASEIFTTSNTGFPPCTAEACTALLDYYQYDLSGKHVVILGRSLTVGKPLAMMLLAKDATVTICHSKTADLETLTKQADFLIVCTGQPKMITEQHLAEHQVVIDVGIHEAEDGSYCGDVDPASIHIPKAITPVPGGIGTITTSILAKHTIEAAKRQL